MTIAESQLLNESMSGLANTLQKNRAMDMQHTVEIQRLNLDAQMRDLQEKRADAAQAHWSKMESGQSEAAAKQSQAEKDRYDLLRSKLGAADAEKKFSDYQKSAGQFMSNVGAQVRAGAMSNTDAAALFSSHIDKLSGEAPALRERFNADPNISLMLSPKFDWSKVGQPPAEPGMRTFTDTAGHSQSGTWVPNPKGGGSFHPMVSPKDAEPKVTITDRIPGTPAKPAKSHWFSADEPAVTAVPDRIIKRTLPAGMAAPVLNPAAASGPPALPASSQAAPPSQMVSTNGPSWTPPRINSQADADAIFAEAQRAVAAGKDPAIIHDRLLKMGFKIDPNSLTAPQ